MSEEKLQQDRVSEEITAKERIARGKAARKHNKKPMTESQKKLFNILTTAIMVVALAVFVYSGYQLYSTWREYKAADDFYENMFPDIPTMPPVVQNPVEPTEKEEPSGDVTDAVEPGTSEETDVTDAPSDSNTETPTDAPTEAPTEAAPPVDWIGVYNQMKAQNPDYIGWIFLGGTKIYYPVVQAEDNDYYLHRLFDGTENFAGTIFADYRCNDVFKSGHTILYGHNMKNGSMFANLRYYEGDWFYYEYPTFTVFTEDGEVKWEIFSIYVTDPGSDTYVTRFGNDEAYVEWLHERQEMSRVKIDMELDASTVTLTLSTCVNNNTQRLVVHARRMN